MHTNKVLVEKPGWAMQGSQYNGKNFLIMHLTNFTDEPFLFLYVDAVQSCEQLTIGRKLGSPSQTFRDYASASL